MPTDLSKFKDAFLSEAKAHLKTMNLSLVELEKDPQQMTALYPILRSAHTLKSLAGTMGYIQIMNLCHEIENLLDAVRNNKIPLSKCTDLLFASFDHLTENLQKVTNNEPESDASGIITQISNLLNTGEIDQQNNQQTPAITMPIEKIQSIEVKVERLDLLMNLAEELLVNKMKIDSISEQIDNHELSSAVESLNRLITELQYHVIQIRLVPIEFVFNRFTRTVRDLAKQQKKEISLEVEGGDIELDRLLIDEISESIGHLIRNAIDHGIEKPNVRKKLNKPAMGIIKIKAHRSKESAIIEISDDGAGFDLDAIKELAVKHKLLKNESNSDDVMGVIFSGLSTTKAVTPLSGRGLGLSIVKQKIESIGGNIKVKTIPNKQTSFFITIPINLAIIKTLFVRVGEQIYAIPIESVERLLDVNSANFKSMMNNDSIIFEGKTTPLLSLANLFGRQFQSSAHQPLVIIHHGDERLGLVVDELLNTYDIVIKPLSGSLRDNKFFSGAALSGSGQVILILDIASIFSTA